MSQRWLVQEAITLRKHPGIKTHGSVSAAKKTRKREKIKIRMGTLPVLYLRDRSSSRFQPIII